MERNNQGHLIDCEGCGSCESCDAGAELEWEEETTETPTLTTAELAALWVEELATREGCAT